MPAKSEKTNSHNTGLRYVYSVLNFTSIKEVDSGEYICTVRNHMGQTNNASVAIEVMEALPCKIRHVQRLDSVMQPTEQTSLINGKTVYSSADSCWPVNVRIYHVI